jgi:hypothetical protein
MELPSRFLDIGKGMYSYSAYGLQIHSALPLPELRKSNGKADVVIRLVEKASAPLEKNGARRQFRVTPEGIHLSWREVGRYLVCGGREILVHPAPGVNASLLRNLILGPALAVILYQRGFFVFHSSAVSINSNVVAFLALKMHGKSTIAAELHARGHKMLTDEIMALEAKDGHLMVQPGVPQFKLWPDSLQAIGEDPELLPLLLPDFEKRARRVSGGFVHSPMPLRCVYVLGFGEEIEISPLQPKEALLNILPHWYGALFDGDLLEIFGAENHLRECAFLVKKVPIYLLKRPVALTALSDVAQAVEQYLAGTLNAGLGEPRATMPP